MITISQKPWGMDMFTIDGKCVLVSATGSLVAKFEDVRDAEHVVMEMQRLAEIDEKLDRVLNLLEEGAYGTAIAAIRKLC